MPREPLDTSSQSDLGSQLHKIDRMFAELYQIIEDAQASPGPNVAEEPETAPTKAGRSRG